MALPEEESGETTITDRDVLIELAGMALSNDELAATDILERLEQLGRSDVVEEAREMQAVLEAAEEDGDPEETSETEEP